VRALVKKLMSGSVELTAQSPQGDKVIRSESFFDRIKERKTGTTVLQLREAMAHTVKTAGWEVTLIY
jgi:hypothetical protein